MAVRLTAGVVRGTLDNTQRGSVTGEVWLHGRDQPLQLKLAGDCLRDLAGCRCTFVNPKPEPDALPDLATDQTGEVGELTASRKAWIPAEPEPPARRPRSRRAGARDRRGNVLYVEWFSDRNGRVIIETMDFAVTVSPPAWTMSPADEERQQALNADAMRRFLDRVQAALMPPRRAKLSPDRDMDEHEWELFLRESEAGSERYGELLDKYLHHPDADVLVARAMGWNELADALENPPPPEAAAAEPDFDDELLAEPVPDPALEGKTWVRTPDGRISHPLVQRCFEFGIRLHHDGEALRQGGRVPTDFGELTFKMQCASAKLAGVLDSLAHDCPLDAGLVAAGIKRALALVNEALGALAQVEATGAIPEQTAAYRDEIFALRSAMLAALDQARRRELPGSD